MLLNDHSVDFADSRNVVDDLIDVRLIQINDVFQECHGGKKDAVIFLLKTRANFG